MTFTVLTKDFVQATYKLFLTSDKEGAFFLCRAYPDSTQREVMGKVMAEYGLDTALIAPAYLKAALRKIIIGWGGLGDPAGKEIPFSLEMIDELCETEHALMERQLDRARHIAREAHLVQEKN